MYIVCMVDFNKKLTFVIVGYEPGTVTTNPRFQWLRCDYAVIMMQNNLLRGNYALIKR